MQVVHKEIEKVRAGFFVVSASAPAGVHARDVDLDRARSTPLEEGEMEEGF